MNAIDDLIAEAPQTRSHSLWSFLNLAEIGTRFPGGRSLQSCDSSPTVGSSVHVDSRIGRHYLSLHRDQPCYIWRIWQSTTDSPSILEFDVNASCSSFLPLFDSGHESYDAALSLPIDRLRWIEAVTGFPQARVATLLGVTRQTINRWHRGFPIDFDNLRQISGVYDVLRRVWSKSPTPEAIVAWLVAPRGVTGVTPYDLLRRHEFDRARLLAITAQVEGLTHSTDLRLLPPRRPLRPGTPRHLVPADQYTDAEIAKMLAELDGEDDEQYL